MNQLSLRPVEQQDKKLPVLWVSDIKSCPRRFWHRVHKTKKQPMHISNVEGLVLHRVATSIVKHEEPQMEIGMDEVKKLDDRSELLKKFQIDLLPHVTALQSWVQNTEVNLLNPEYNVAVEAVYDGSFIYRGKIDLLTSEYIIDFKKGSYRSNSVPSIQLVSYNELKTANGEQPRKLLNVYLGGAKPTEMVTEGAKLEKHRTTLYEFLDMWKYLIPEVLLGKKPQCMIDFSCVFCEYRGLCDGF